MKHLSFPKPTKKIKVKKTLNRVRKTSHAKAKREAWKAFADYIKMRDALGTTQTHVSAKCVTCPYAYDVKAMQAGHFLPGRKNIYLFSEEQVHAQCFRCNINLKGNWTEYYKYMVETWGQDNVNTMIYGKWDTIQLKVPELIEIRDRYKLKLAEL